MHAIKPGKQIQSSDPFLGQLQALPLLSFLWISYMPEVVTIAENHEKYKQMGELHFLFTLFFANTPKVHWLGTPPP